MWEWLITNLGNITGIITAVGAVIAAIGAVAAAIIGLKQVRVSQKQVDLIIEANYDSHRPVLVPIQGLRTASMDYNWDSPIHFVQVHNVGTGVATNIVGVMFPSVSLKDTKYFAVKFIDPMIQGGSNDKIGLSPTNDTIRLRGEQVVKDKYSLYAPHDAVARITFTYHDIFGHKHASICDFFNQWTSRSVVFLPNIPKDLEELRLEKNN